MPPKQLYTIGHSTRPLPELVQMLQSNGVNLLVDVRTIPKSRTNPQFNKEALEQQLPQEHDMAYEWMGKELGGLRKRDKTSDSNAGWDNASFRGYADYMGTQEFEDGLQQLMQLVSDLPEGEAAAIMCAEVVQFRCHRSLIADALTARGWQVRHILAPDKAPTPHKLTSFAAVQPGSHRVTYPAYEHTPKAPRQRKVGRGGGSSTSGSRGRKRSSSEASSK